MANAWIMIQETNLEGCLHANEEVAIEVKRWIAARNKHVNL